MKKTMTTKMMKTLLIPVLAAVTLSLSGCARKTIRPYTPKKREYEVPEYTQKDTVSSPGSLWQKNRPASMLFSDARALREQDIVIVRIEEVASAKRSAETEVSRDASANASVSAFLRTAAQNPSVDGGLTMGAGSRFEGAGSTGRSDRFTATVPAVVRKVLPNGNLFVEGHRVVLVNDEEHHFYISGVVRPIDIDEQNSIKSSAIADAEIEFTGRGVLTDGY